MKRLGDNNKNDDDEYREAWKKLNETNTKDVLWKQIVYIIDTFFGMVVDDNDDDIDAIIVEKLVGKWSVYKVAFKLKMGNWMLLYLLRYIL